MLRRALAVAFLAVLVAVPAGLAAETPNPLVAAAEKMAAVKSARFVARTSTLVQPPGAPRPLPLVANGALDNVSMLARITSDLSPLATVGGVKIGQPADWRVDAVIDERALIMYMKFPFLRKLAGTTKPWFRLDLKAAARQGGVDLSQLTQLTQQDPAQQVALLQAAVQVREVGHERVGGVETDHYRAVVDLEKLPPSLRAQGRELIRLSGQRKLPYEAWIDAGGLIRRVGFAYTIKGPLGLTKVSGTIDLSDFDAPVDIQTPPAAQTVDLLKLSKKTNAKGGA